MFYSYKVCFLNRQTGTTVQNKRLYVFNLVPCLQGCKKVKEKLINTDAK